MALAAKGQVAFASPGCAVPSVAWAVLTKCVEMNPSKPKAEEEGTSTAEGGPQGAGALV